MKNFSFEKPRDLGSLLEIKKENKEKCLILAGGTNLYVYLKDRIFTEGVITDITGLKELKGILLKDGYLELGACERISTLLDSETLKNSIPMLHNALTLFANPLVRDMATLGGNLADCSPIADTAPTLLVLKAEVVVADSTGERIIPLKDFFLGPRKTVMKDTEVLLRVRVPIPEKGSGLFAKIGLRKGTSCSVTSVAVWLEEAGKKVSDIRIALGGVAAKPLRVANTEKAFLGADLTVEKIKELSANLKKDIKPITDVRGSAEYRLAVSTNMLARTVASLAGLEVY